jgi:hypothetical protein
LCPNTEYSISMFLTTKQMEENQESLRILFEFCSVDMELWNLALPTSEMKQNLKVLQHARFLGLKLINPSKQFLQTLVDQLLEQKQKNMHTVKMEKISLEPFDYSNEIGELIGAQHRLRTLSISGLMLSEAAVHQFGSRLPRTLEKVSFNRINIPHTSSLVLLGTFVASLQNLRSLECTAVGYLHDFSPFLSAFANHASLVKLKISNQQIIGNKARSWYDDLPVLQRLELKENLISNNFLQGLLNSVKKHPSMIKL